MKKYLIFFLISFNVSFGQGWFSCITPTETPLNSLKEYNGKLILGGFGIKGKHILSYDGVSFDTVGITSDYPSIWAIEVYNNDLYIGGDFTTINGITMNGIARYDGVSWYPMGFGVSGSSSFVRSMEVYNGELYIAGDFTYVDGVAAKNIAKWDGLTWSALGPGLNYGVSSLAVYQNQLYAGGVFSLSGNDTVNGIASWDGSTWQALTTGVSSNSGSSGFEVMALQEYNGELYAGGNFYTAGGVNSSYVAKWNGTAWSAFPQYFWGLVSCFDVYNNKLFIGGFFIDQSGSTKYVGSWDGSTFNNLDSGLNSTSSFKHVWCSEVYNNRIYFGGNILGSVHHGLISKGIIAWDEFNSGVEEMKLYNNIINVAPNPVNNVFKLNGDVPSVPYRVQIIDVSGRSVLDEVKYDYHFDSYFLKAGVYQLLIDSSNQHQTVRIVKM